MLLRRRSSMTFVALWLLVMGVVACGSPLRTAACGLNTYGTAIQEQLNALVALDPALVAQAGTPENAAANEALDALDQSAADGQAALDATSTDEITDRIRSLFQGALDLTTAATTALRSAIDSGDPATVTAAMEDVQAASDAIGQFLAATGDIDCPSPEPSASEAVATPTVAPTLAPTPEPTLEPTVAPTPEPTTEPTAEPTEEPTAEPTEEPTTEPTAEPTATPTLEPTPTLSPSPTASPSATASASPSASPAPEPSDEGTGGLLPWVVGIGLLGGGAAAIYFWYRSNQTPPDDGLGPDGEPLPDGGGAVEDTTPGVGPGAAAVAGTAGAASAGVSDETMVNETPPAGVEPPPAEDAEPASETRPPGEPPAQ